MRCRRAGFTLIEVVTVIVILGILVAIVLARFWQVRQRAMAASVQADLRNLAVRQELYFESRSTYADALSSLNPVQLSPGVQIEITYGDTGGWAARGWHESTAGRVCGLFVGNGAAGSAAPAVMPGVVTCD